MKKVPLKPLVPSVRRLRAPVHRLARRDRHTHTHTHTHTNSSCVCVYYLCLHTHIHSHKITLPHTLTPSLTHYLLQQPLGIGDPSCIPYPHCTIGTHACTSNCMHRRAAVKLRTVKVAVQPFTNQTVIIKTYIVSVSYPKHFCSNIGILL